jgi:hypothetical protein
MIDDIAGIFQTTQQTRWCATFNSLDILLCHPTFSAKASSFFPLYFTRRSTVYCTVILTVLTYSYIMFHRLYRSQRRIYACGGPGQMSSWRPPSFANHPMMNKITCVVPSLSMWVPPFDVNAGANSHL